MGTQKESGTAENFASVAELAADVKQIPLSISIASYVYLFAGVYLVVYSIVFLCVGHWVDICLLLLMVSSL